MAKRHLGPTAVMILAALAGAVTASPVVGDRAPVLVLPEINRSRFDLAMLRGKVVIVNFWATWCAPCRAEMPTLDHFYARFHERGVEMIGISADHKRDRKAVVKASQAVHYPVAMLDEAETNRFGKPDVLPVTFVVDGEGIVRAVLTPKSLAVTEEALEGIVSPLLANHHAPVDAAPAPISSSHSSMRSRTFTLSVYTLTP